MTGPSLLRPSLRASNPPSIAARRRCARGAFPSSAALVAFACASIVVAACGPADRGGGEQPGSASRAIQNKGSDTMVNIALAWAEAYQGVAPDVSIAVTGGGSGTGIASLVNGTVDIANASRDMKPDELDDARASGMDPQEFVVAVDALAIIVHPDNPVSRLTIDQLADIFSGRVLNWQAVGGNDAPIILVSRETNSGTHVYFLEEVVRKGDGESTAVFAPQTLLMPSSVGITSEVRRNPNAIGYDGLGYVDAAHEKLIAVAKDESSAYVSPSVATGSDGSYPIARQLYMYTAQPPTGAIADYLDWVRGPAGQQIVRDLGFVPLPPVEAAPTP